jgi:hypothetical protein
MHPPGTIILGTGSVSRFPAASMSLISLVMPLGSRVVWVMGVNIAANLNNAIRQSQGGWVWITADDHNFAPDTLIRLLNHGKDIVAPLCLLRGPPYSPLVFRDELSPGVFDPWPADELPLSGLHPVAASGGGGLLLSREVLDTVGDPWFEIGKVHTDELSEDLWFFSKARLAGYQPYVDFDSAIGHITPMAIWPTKTPEGRWQVTLDATCMIPSTAHVEGLAGEFVS